LGVSFAPLVLPFALAALVIWLIVRHKCKRKREIHRSYIARGIRERHTLEEWYKFVCLGRIITLKGSTLHTELSIPGNEDPCEKALQMINRILAIAIIFWGIVVPVYLLAFAQVSYTSTTSSAVQGEAPTTEVVSGSQPWRSGVQPVSVLIMLVFSALLVGGGIAVWKGALAELVILTMLALVGSYMTGFSIGGLYLPGTIALTLATVLTAVAARLRNQKSLEK
jgi:hypothetical protein